MHPITLLHSPAVVLELRLSPTLYPLRTLRPRFVLAQICDFENVDTIFVLLLVCLLFQVKLEEKRPVEKFAPSTVGKPMNFSKRQSNADCESGGGGAGESEERTGEKEAEGGDEIETLTAEAEEMKKEISEQDRLLQAYQKENEKLLDRAKKVGCVSCSVNPIFVCVIIRLPSKNVRRDVLSPPVSSRLAL